MDVKVKQFLSEIGRKGGKASKRKLDRETARSMVRVREARRAYRKYHPRCFWSFDPEYVVTLSDVEWVAEQLRKNGNRDAWELAAKLCR